MNLDNILAKHSADIDDVNRWSDLQYNEYFSRFFNGARKLYDRLNSKDDPITDTELEWILTDLPLELFSASEQLSNLRTMQEVIKMNIKKREREYIKACDSSLSETKKKEQASVLTEEDRLLVAIYDNIAERVSRQMTFSKELIMSAKKIWDARRSDGIPLPEIATADNSLPEYDFNK